MNQTIKVLLSASIACCAGSALAGEAIVHVNQAGKGANKIVGIDLQSGGDVSAFQFLITLPEDAKGVNVGSCLAGLPKSHTGLCEAKDNKVAGVIYSFSNAPLPSGLTSVGQVTYKSTSKTKPMVGNVVAGNKSGQEITGARGETEAVNLNEN